MSLPALLGLDLGVTAKSQGLEPGLERTGSGGMEGGAGRHGDSEHHAEHEGKSGGIALARTPGKSRGGHDAVLNNRTLPIVKLNNLLIR